jgi:hypothetical protein
MEENEREKRAESMAEEGEEARESAVTRRRYMPDRYSDTDVARGYRTDGRPDGRDYVQDYYEHDHPNQRYRGLNEKRLAGSRVHMSNYFPDDEGLRAAVPVGQLGIDELKDKVRHRWSHERARNKGKTRASDGVIKDERPYSDEIPVQLGEGYHSRDFEYGYSFLPPDKWYPEPPHPPVCVSEKRCPVCPTYTTGVPADVKEWDSTRRITGPYHVNTEYVEDKMNSGR